MGKKLFSALALMLALVMANEARADFYVPGGFDIGTNWDPNSNPMTDIGGGIWELSLTGLVANSKFEFKVLDIAGDWDSYVNLPDISNSWGYSDGTGNMTIRLDTNSLGNGWLKDSNRIILANDVTSWNVVGSFMDEAGGTADWQNGDPLFTMTDLGGGVYGYTAIISTPGSYEWKAVATGSWDAIGTQGRTVNAWSWNFDTIVANQAVDFFVDTSTGSIFMSTIPEPSAMGLLGLVAVAGLVRRRRK